MSVSRDVDDEDSPRSVSPHSWRPGRALRQTGPRRLALGALFVITLTAFGALAHKASHSFVSRSVGHEDPERSQRWHTGHVTLTIDESTDALGFDARPVIQQALGGWRKLGTSTPKIAFERGTGLKASLTPDGKNGVLLAPIDIPGHETDLAVTIGFSNPHTGEISEADIIINSRHLFSQLDAQALESPESCLPTSENSQCRGTYDLENVLAHEFGHFFGLGENPNDPRATMYSCTSACETHKRDLEPADVEALVTLYASAPIAGLGCGAAQFSQGRGALGSESALTGLLALGAVIWARRRVETS